MRAILEHMASPVFAIFALVFFGFSFAAIVVWAFRIQPASLQKRMAELPLNDDEGVLQ